MHRVDGPVMLCTLVEDSRLVQPGSIFLARQGATTDGRDWITQAEKDGASLILSDRSGCDRASGPALSCDDPVRIGALLAERLHGSPSSGLELVGITGTNGKTTTATILQHLLANDDAPCGLIGGIEVDDGRARTPATLTTPQAADLSRTLGRMIGNGCRFAVMEVSSHALDLGRVSGLHFSAALFTNLSGDHLAHHGDMDSYAEAKRSLYSSLAHEAVAVINVDDPRISVPAKTGANLPEGGMEGLIFHFKSFMHGHGIRPDKGEVYVPTEAPNGELGYYMVSDGTEKPYRWRVRPPSFYNYQAFPNMCIGGLFSDVIASLSSINVIAGELDR